MKVQTMNNDCLVITIAVCASIGMHALVLPLVSASESLAHSPTTKATHLKTPKLENDEIELGIDNSTTSTLTWIGYDEYEEQRARVSEIEQAEMNADVSVSPTKFQKEATPQESRPEKEILDKFVESLQKSPFLVLKNKTEALQSGQTDEPPTPAPDVVPAEPSEPAEPIKPSEPAQPDEPSEPVKPSDSSSDRDSEATSVIQISPEQWKTGKPLAANGIVLRPKRPSFTANQTVSNIAGNLVADLIINKHGKPTDVIIQVSTGSFSIDRAIESSLYRWRASGKNIDALVDDETIPITINVLFR